MYMLAPTHYQGYAYLQLSRMPFDHLLHITNWISDTDIISIGNRMEILEN